MFLFFHPSTLLLFFVLFYFILRLIKFYIYFALINYVFFLLDTFEQIDSAELFFFYVSVRAFENALNQVLHEYECAAEYHNNPHIYFVK